MIVVEEFLGVTPEPPLDYKFFVFHGRVEMIQVDTGRFREHRRNLYTREWDSLDVEYMHPRSNPEAPPPNLDIMLRAAEALGCDTDFVRVDLYDLGDRVVFGELTHCPGGAIERFSKPELDERLGSLWSQPLIYQRAFPFQRQARLGGGRGAGG